jgi:hypothetical protein
MRLRKHSDVTRAAARWQRTRVLTLAAALVATVLTTAPAATAKPDPHPLTTWSSYEVCDPGCTSSETIFLRADSSRPAVDIYGSRDPGTVYSVRIVRFYEANSDTLAPYDGTELNLLTPMWTLSQPGVAPQGDGESLDFSYSTGPRRHRYAGIQFRFHAQPTETGITLKIDTLIQGYQWQSTDPTAALILEAQLLVNGEPVSGTGFNALVYSHFDGDLVHDPPLF